MCSFMHRSKVKALLFPVVGFAILIVFSSAAYSQTQNSDQLSTKEQQEEQDFESLTPDATSGAQADELASGTAAADTAFSNWHIHAPSYFDTSPTHWFFLNEVKAGFALAKGNSDSITLSGTHAFIARLKSLTNTLSGGAMYSRSSSDGSPASTTTQYFFAEDKLSWEFAKRFYTYGELGWFTDQPRGIAHSYRAEPGLGYYLVDSSHHTLSAELGYAFEYEDQVAPATNQRIHAAVVGCDYTLSFTERIQLQESADFLTNLQHSRDLRLHSTTSLKVKFSNHVGMATSFDLAIDNEPVAGEKKYDLTNTVSLLVDF